MATWTLRKKFTFEAAHFLPDHDGKCQRMHGHSWVGWAVLEGETLQLRGPKAGMLVDYGDVSVVLKPMVDTYLDHYLLNDSLPGLKNPTSENVAKWVFNFLSPKLALLRAVEIEETCTSACIYRPTA
jgi:6-pyruvoyltetrahydropterin/6-carboxytetrahydropterin synthase